MGLDDSIAGSNGEENSEDEIAKTLEKWKIDPDFVVEAQYRPKGKHSDFFDSSTESIPVIDLAPVSAHDDEGIQKVVEEIGKACEKWGFFQVVNHGVPITLLDHVEAAAADFFALPSAEKSKVKGSLENPLGYFEEELTKNRRDWKQVLDFVYPGEFKHSTTRTLRNQWPENPPQLREVCERWSAAVHALAFQLLDLITQSLKLPGKYFFKHFEGCSSAVRLNYYPVCPIPDLALGVSRHKDAGALTVLVQDNVGGLQVRRKDGEWIGVKPNRDAFVINVGDTFQVWSNDKYQSIEHRVVVNENKARFSLPLFFNPAFDAPIAPAPELTDEQHPPHYRTFTFGEFMDKRVEGNINQIGEDIQIHDFAIPSLT